MKSSNLSYGQGTFAIVDTETTGTSPAYNRIIEIGIVRVEQGKVVDTFQSLVNPECEIAVLARGQRELAADPDVSTRPDGVRPAAEGRFLPAERCRALPPGVATRRGLGSPSNSSTETPRALAMADNLLDRGIWPLRSQ